MDGWEDNAKPRAIMGSQIYSVETVADVQLKHVDSTIGRVSQEDFSEETMKGVTILHGVQVCKWNCIGIDA